MNKKMYQNIVNKYTPKEKRKNNIIVSFISGGIMGLIGNLLINIYSNYFSLTESGILMILTLIFIACLLTAIGKFDSMVNICKMGLIIPITGFAHATTSAAIDYRKEGMVTGIGMNMFKLSGSVIIYGVTSAFIVGLIRYLIGAL